MTVPQGTFELERVPRAGSAPLRAWDASDELVLRHLDELEVAVDARMLVVNDAFGAIGTALGDRSLAWWSDSATARRALADNLEANGRDLDAVQLVGGPGDELDGVYDLITIRVPRTLSLLDHQLARVRPHLHADSVVVGHGMVKLIHTSTLDRFGERLGTTTTSLATKKARLIHPVIDAEFANPPEPTTYRLPWGQTVVSHAGVFSAERLDRGTRLCANALADLDLRDVGSILDLGCGSGVLGLVTAGEVPEALVHFVDESDLAVSSARATWSANDRADDRATFTAAVDLAHVPDASVDLVVCNPPFHQQQARTDDVASQMIRDARRVLRPGGRFVLVGNRHLGYHVRLKRGFRSVETIASDPKFVVLAATG